MTDYHPLVTTLASNLRVSASSLPKIKPLNNHLLDKHGEVNGVFDDDISKFKSIIFINE